MIFNRIENEARVKALHAAGGLPKGDSTGFRSVDPLYTVGLGQFTVVTGTPGSGKSEWLDAVMVNLALKGNWRFVIYSPENQPLELHYAKILEKYTGKPFTPGPTKRMDEEELDDALSWMHGKFHFGQPSRPEIVTILREALDFAPISGKTGIVIDPWNYLEHHRPAGFSETEYVSSVLSEVLSHVRKNNVHLWLVAHPSKLQRSKDGKLPVPTPHDISGSAHFWNKADNCITVWRDASDYSNPNVDIHVQKVRFKHIGRVGLATLLYDRITGRYADKGPEGLSWVAA